MSAHTGTADTQRSAFEYLLNAMEEAALARSPSKHGYGEKRCAVLEHVANMERELAAARAGAAPVQASAWLYCERGHENNQSNGSCWICGSRNLSAAREGAAPAEAEGYPGMEYDYEQMRLELQWCVEHDGECLGDHPYRLEKARAALKGAAPDAAPQAGSTHPAIEPNVPTIPQTVGTLAAAAPPASDPAYIFQRPLRFQQQQALEQQISAFNAEPDEFVELLDALCGTFCREHERDPRIADVEHAAGKLRYWAVRMT